MAERVPLLDSLDAQVALVTGANRGMGRLIAESLMGLGASVFAGVRDPAHGDAPQGAISVALDVTENSSVQAAIERVKDEAGRLDILVNNAGIAPGARHDLVSEPLWEIDDVLATNLRGAIVVTKHALPLLLARSGSRVVCMSSGMGGLSEGMNGSAPAYRISKAGMNGLTCYLHGEYHGARGLIANAVCPGWVRTEMGGPGATRDPEEGIQTPVWLCRFAPAAPSGKWWRDKAVIPW